MMYGSGSRSRYPFTESQWQELEHQAIIFRYLVSGIPVPNDLILPIRRSHLLDFPTLCFPHLPSAGWGCFQMGCGRKVEDPEPGRCRRTDGKKWRCSKEACPDSKYCERHMHRGKRSSRKQVDLSLASNPTSSRLSSPYSSLLSLSPPEADRALFPSSSSSGSPSISLSAQNNIPYSHLETVSLSADKSNRELYGLKEDVNEYNFFSEDSRAEREGKFRPLVLSSMGEIQQSSDQNLITNFAIALASEEDKVVESEGDSRKASSFDCLFDEWPERSTGAWIILEENQSKRASYSNTQLSISSSQYHNGLMMLEL
ncbi:growth-regulating factor 1-like isoform X1 [Phoenix dactylifera]|uniref:Growth-regulating factor n=1 Tax=Phoenix dactylifera TaxID=42345 RepID=A0A8B9AVC1_PHODC|nr:growth-regulating factor 1-like isoform X1 [Phoenix dactylifera]